MMPNLTRIVIAAGLLMAGASWIPAAPPTNAWEYVAQPPGTTTAGARDIQFSANGDLYASFGPDGIWCRSAKDKTWKNLTHNLPEMSGGAYLCFNSKGDLMACINSAKNRGIYRLPAGGSSWEEAKINAKLKTSEFPQRMTLNKAGGIICGTFSIQVLRSTDDGATFDSVSPIMGGNWLYDLQTNPVTKDLYIGTETGPEHCSTDGGVTWTDIGKPGGNARFAFNRKGEVFCSSTHDAERKNWTLARYTAEKTWVQSDKGLPPGQDTRSSALSGSGQMFIGNTNVYQSDDDGATWRLAGSDFPTPKTGTPQVSCLRVGGDGYLYASVSKAATDGIWRLKIGAAAAQTTTGKTPTSAATK